MSKQEFVIFYCRSAILTNTSRELLKSHAMKCNRAADERGNGADDERPWGSQGQDSTAARQ